jgi:hypothetical protein
MSEFLQEDKKLTSEINNLWSKARKLAEEFVRTKSPETSDELKATLKEIGDRTEKLNGLYRRLL